MACEHPNCPYWQGQEPLALNPHVLFDHIEATSGLPKKASRMLKAGAPIPRRKARES
jgi:hypothetical protein